MGFSGAVMMGQAVRQPSADAAVQWCIDNAHLLTAAASGGAAARTWS
jgi:hypothetical protein